MGCLFSSSGSQRSQVSQPSQPPVSPISNQARVSPSNANKNKQNKRDLTLSSIDLKEIPHVSIPINEANKKNNTVSNKEKSLAFKEKGNQFYKNKNYQLAIKEYSKAIELFNEESVYYSNRALCFKFLGKFDQVLVDAEVCIKLDPDNYKGYHLKGIALGEQGKFEQTNNKLQEGIDSLEKCLEIIKKKNDFQAMIEINIKLKKMKKVFWLKENEIKQLKASDTKDYIQNLISKDKTLSGSEKKETLDFIGSLTEERVEKLQQKDIPEALCCKITFEIMKHPVLSSSGISYEKEVLLEHLAKGGNFDPMTRQYLAGPDLIKNSSLNKAITQFEEKNPWSLDPSSSNEDYRSISFV